jgi:hypothetical protein
MSNPGVTLPISQEAIAASIKKDSPLETIGTGLPAGFIEIDCTALAESRGVMQTQCFESTSDELKRYECLFEKAGHQWRDSFSG